MRRTRHVVLPVRSWQYIGFLVVSLACLTLGLVSRDREGRAGSLAGPELEHRAPHEVDACPNLNVLTDKLSCSDPMDGFPNLKENLPNEISENFRVSRSRISRSRSLDRRSSSVKFRDYRKPETLTESRRIKDRTDSREIRNFASRRSTDLTTRRSQSLDRRDSRDRQFRLTKNRGSNEERREMIDRRNFVDRRNDLAGNRDRRFRSAELNRVEIRRNRQSFSDSRGADQRSFDVAKSRTAVRDRRSTERQERLAGNHREIPENSRDRRVLERGNDVTRIRRDRSDLQERRSRVDLYERRSRSLERTDINRQRTRENLENRRSLSRSDLREYVGRRNNLDERRSRSMDRRENNLNRRETLINRRFERSDVRDASRLRNSRSDLYERRSRSTERRENILNRRENRETLMNRRFERTDLRDSSRLRQSRSDLQERRSRSMERRENNLNRRENRETLMNRRSERSDLYERRALSTERRENNLNHREKRAIPMNRRSEFSIVRDSSGERRTRVDLPRSRSTERRTNINIENRQARWTVESRLESSRFNNLRSLSRNNVDESKREILDRRLKTNVRQIRNSRSRFSDRREDDERRNLISRERRFSERNAFINTARRENGRINEIRRLNRRSLIRSVKFVDPTRLTRQERTDRLSRESRRQNSPIVPRVLENNVDQRRSKSDENSMRQIRRISPMSLQFGTNLEMKSLNKRSVKLEEGRRNQRSADRRSINLGKEIRERQNLNLVRRSVEYLVNPLRKTSRLASQNIREIRQTTAKDSRFTQEIRDERHMAARMKVDGLQKILKNNDALAYGTVFEIARQIAIMTLCTVYGLSVFGGKGSFIGNAIQRANRFIVW